MHACTYVRMLHVQECWILSYAMLLLLQFHLKSLSASKLFFIQFSVSKRVYFSEFPSLFHSSNPDYLWLLNTRKTNNWVGVYNLVQTRTIVFLSSQILTFQEGERAARTAIHTMSNVSSSQQQLQPYSSSSSSTFCRRFSIYLSMHSPQNVLRYLAFFITALYFVNVFTHFGTNRQANSLKV